LLQNKQPKAFSPGTIFVQGTLAKETHISRRSNPSKLPIPVILVTVFL